MTSEHDYSGIELRLLYLLAETVDRRAALRRILDTEGTTYETPTGQIKARPEVAQEQAALASIKSLTHEIRAAIAHKEQPTKDQIFARRFAAIETALAMDDQADRETLLAVSKTHWQDELVAFGYATQDELNEWDGH